MRPATPNPLVYPGLGERIRRSFRREDARRTRASITHTLRVLESVSATLKDVSGITSLGDGLDVPSEVLQRAQRASSNTQEIAMLQECVDNLSVAIDELLPHGSSGDVSPSTLGRVELLLRKWADIGRRLHAAKRRSRFRWFFKGDEEASILAPVIHSISTSIHEFLQREGELEDDIRIMAPMDQVNVIQIGVEQVPHDTSLTQLQVGVPDIVTNQDALRGTTEAVAQPKNDDSLPRSAKDAAYNANEARKPCLPGTRVALFQRVRNWVALACAAHPPAGQVMWINGLAGTGKTTVAYSIADEYRKEGMLGGSFFCSRFNAECSDPKMVFTTLSSQLSSFHGPFRAKVVAALKDNPDIANAGPARQLEELVVRPLEEVHDTFPVCVIVIDALDECKDAASLVLSVLIRFIHRLDRLLFVVTSRPEAAIAAVFQKSGGTLQEATTPLILNEIHLGLEPDDIKFYLTHQFGAARQTFRVPEGWPSRQDIDALADRSDGLWIHAVTAVKSVLDDSYGGPEWRLQLLLSERPSPMKSSLYSLYTQIANTACTTTPHELIDQLRSILGVIVVAREPLSIGTFAGLLCTPASVIRSALQGLHSILDIPADDFSAVRVTHPTFLEFLISPLASKPAAFCIEPTEHHLAVFHRSVDVMLTSLKYDICDIGDPTLFKREVTDLSEKIKLAISPSLCYACQHWVAHFSEARSAEAAHGTFAPLREFLHRHLLNWFEVCSLSDALDDAVIGIDSARRTCQTLAGPFLDLVPLLYDCRRFILTFSPCIKTAPLQAHHSALSLTPHKTLMSQLYSEASKRRGHPFVVRDGRSPDWGSCVDVYTGHGGAPVYSVAFSPDGLFFASGGEDGCINIWSATTRTLFLSIQCPPFTHISCLAFSPDGTYLSSTLSDGTVRVCQASTGSIIHTLESGAEALRFVAYSSDGTRILTAAGDGQMRLWDSADGRPLLTLGGALAARQVALSPDESIIAYGADETLQLLNLASGESESLAMEEGTISAAFSADGRYMAAVTYSHICIWAYPSKVLLHSLEIRGANCRIAFSADSRQLIYGLVNGLMHLWRLPEDEQPYVFKAHDREVHDVAWSPDGFQAVSVGEDGTICVWDTTRRLASDEEKASPPLSAPPAPSLDLQRPSSNDHLRCIQALATKANAHQRRNAFNWTYTTGRASAASYEWTREVLSTDGRFRAQIPANPRGEVRICDTHTGALSQPLGYAEDILSMAFSPDSRRVAMGSRDGTINVRKTTSWRIFASYSHNKSALACSFSSSGDRVISGSANKFARIFNISSRNTTHELGPHEDSVVEVAFGMDNDYVISQDSSHKFYVWRVIDGGHPELVHAFTFDDDAWLRSIDFSPDDASFCLRRDGEDLPKISLWPPGTRVWPVYNVTGEGWIYAKGPGYTRRVGWTLPNWRDPLGSEGGMFYVLDSSGRRLVSLDFITLR